MKWLKEKLVQPIKSWLWFGLLLLIAFATLWVVIYNVYKESITEPQPILSTKTSREARLYLDFGDGKKRAFEGRVIGGMNVYHALLASAKAGNFGIKMTPKEEGLIVEEINGFKNTDSKGWHYYLNSIYKDMLSPAAEPIEAGDRIEFRYE